MDRNTIIGILLIAVIFIGFSYYNNLKLKKAYEREIIVADSLYQAKDYETARTTYRKAFSYKPKNPYPEQKIREINQIIGVPFSQADTIQEKLPVEKKPDEIPVPETVTGTLLSPEEQKDIYGSFAGSVEGEKEFYTLENNLIKINFSTLGGRVYSAELKKYTTYDSLPLILFNGDSTIFGFEFFTRDNKAIATNNLYFSPIANGKNLIANNSARTISMLLQIEQEKYIEYIYTLEPNSYMLDVDINIVGMKDIFPANLNSLDLSWEIFLPQQEKGRQNENMYTSIKYKYYQDEVDGFREKSSKDLEEREITTKVRWLAFKDQFFSSVLIADNYFLNAWVQSQQLPESAKHLRHFLTKLGIPYEGKSKETVNLSFYFGPNHFNTLKKYNLELEELVSMGKNIVRWINRFAIIPVFNWLNKYINNYGIIILLLTIIIKMVLFPLTYKSFLSQAKMRVLKPQVDEINARYPKKEDAMKKQQATMAFYKKAGVSPMGGCLPMLLQFPILFAMFRFFPTSIELRQQGFLWAHDLSTYDSILDLPFNIPMYGDHVSLFTLLMTASTIITMKINSPSTSGSPQMPGMKGMMYIMPIMFMLILNKFSAGLTYYYFLANIITFAQNMISKRFVNEDEILKKLQENKKKPVKKSKWQQRLEAAAKQRGSRPPKKR
jgi:YidC/Oxa1 family membrane protein insertase